MPKLLIFMPTLNEVNSAANLIHDLHRQISFADFLVIDDGSTDGTVEELSALKLKKLKIITRGKRLGIGSAHKTAIQFAKQKNYSFLITMDADGTHRTEDVLTLFENREIANVVIGSRFMDGSSIIDWSISRIFLTRIAHLVTKYGLKLPFDSSSGLRSYSLNKISNKLIQEISNLDSNGYEFFFKSLMLMNLRKVLIADFPVKLEARKLGASKMDFISASKSVYKLFQTVLYFRILKRF